MRKLLILPLALTLSGCLSMGAKPLRYECNQAAAFRVAYAGAALITEIQAEAGGDLAGAPPQWSDPTKVFGYGQRESDPLYRALAADAAMSKAENRLDAQSSNLLLSGGGQWGAFGSGFLHRRQQLEPQFYRVITGVSTGALQAMLIGMGNYDALVKEYRINRQDELISAGGAWTAFRKGFLNDTDPLRRRVEDLLCGTDGTCDGLRKLAGSGSQVFVGSVELATGQFHSFHISAMAKAAYGMMEGKPKLTEREAQQCIAGAVMASVAMPAYLRPVSLGGKTYVDGGVRLSMFEAVLGSYVQDAAAKYDAAVPLDVVRNGPTILQPDKLEPDGMFAADAKPDVGKVALRSYSAMVNQSEVMSLAALRLSRPTGSIRYITADGYRAKGDCIRTPAKSSLNPDMFDPQFMRCLVEWGERRANQGWRTLSALALPPPETPPAPATPAATPR